VGAIGGRYLTDEELRQAGFRKLGVGVKIHERASLYGTEQIELGDFVRIDDYSVIVATGPLKVGDYVHIPNFCFLGSRFGIDIGSFVTLAPGVMLFTASDEYRGGFLTGAVVPRELTGGAQGTIRLEDHVLLGAYVVVLPGCHLQEGAAVGAHSLVKQDLDPWVLYAGVPVKKIAERNRQGRHWASLVV
jgi:acetyltransferase-like isoleucine patch superfamily enzyme